MTSPIPAAVMQRLRSSSGGALLCALLCAGCVKELPPAARPKPVSPRLPAAAPPRSGRGRLIVDVVDGPTPVQRVRMQAKPKGGGRTGVWFARRSELLCVRSPCAADLPAGNVLLGFPVIGNSDRLDVELVHVDAGISVYRRALSVYHPSRGAAFALGIIGAALGATAATTGAVLLPIGLAKHNNGLTEAGGITLAAGAVALALGIWGIHVGAPTYRPGSAIHFRLNAAAH